MADDTRLGLMSDERLEILISIADVAKVADAKFGDFASMHEAWGVLQEEFIELQEAIMYQQTDPRTPHTHPARGAGHRSCCSSHRRAGI